MVFLLVSVWLAAAAADCSVEQSSGASLPMAIDLGGRRSGPGSQVFVDIPIAPKDACTDTPPAPSDVLRGEPGDLLNPAH